MTINLTFNLRPNWYFKKKMSGPVSSPDKYGRQVGDTLVCHYRGQRPVKTNTLWFFFYSLTNRPSGVMQWSSGTTIIWSPFIISLLSRDAGSEQLYNEVQRSRNNWLTCASLGFFLVLTFSRRYHLTIYTTRTDPKNNQTRNCFPISILQWKNLLYFLQRSLPQRS